MNINEIEIGTKWEDTLGKAKFNKNGIIILKERLLRIVTITNKTSNSIQYIDDGGFYSWITFDDFIRVESSNKKNRFIKNNLT
jgi:hypothetical protein